MRYDFLESLFKHEMDSCDRLVFSRKEKNGNLLPEKEIAFFEGYYAAVSFCLSELKRIKNNT